jgi:hypothetical protein
MRHFKPLPSKADLQKLFTYSFVEGALYWNDSSSRLAGSVNGGRGYVRVCIDYITYGRHRLVWAYFYGDPGFQIVDHVNNDRSDDRIENLRLATESDNRRNSRMYCTNTSGFKGVTLEKSVNKWKAYIYRNNRRIHLGIFRHKEEAAAAYAKAAQELHGAFAGALQ